MDAKLIEVMVVIFLTLLVFWLMTRLCFRIMKVLVTKGPDFIKYLIIVCGIVGLIWTYYNPNTAKILYQITKSRLLGGVSSSPLNEDNSFHIEGFERKINELVSEITKE